MADWIFKYAIPYTSFRKWSTKIPKTILVRCCLLPHTQVVSQSSFVKWQMISLVFLSTNLYYIYCPSSQEDMHMTGISSMDQRWMIGTLANINLPLSHYCSCLAHWLSTLSWIMWREHAMKLLKPNRRNPHYESSLWTNLCSSVVAALNSIIDPYHEALWVFIGYEELSRIFVILVNCLHIISCFIWSGCYCW